MSVGFPTRFRALFCLLALVLLHAPLLADLVPAPLPPCCAHGMCPAMKMAQQTQRADSSDEMQCHHASAPAGDCSMSCCHTSVHQFSATANYLLPRPQSAPVLRLTASAYIDVNVSALAPHPDPLSPPPRSLSIA